MSLHDEYKKETCLPFGLHDVSNLRELHLDFPVPQDGNFPDPQMKSTKMLDVMLKKTTLQMFPSKEGRNIQRPKPREVCQVPPFTLRAFDKPCRCQPLTRTQGTEDKALGSLKVGHKGGLPINLKSQRASTIL